MRQLIIILSAAIALAFAGYAESVTEGGRPAGQAKAVRFIRMEDGNAVFAIGSGNYRLASKYPF